MNMIKTGDMVIASKQAFDPRGKSITVYTVKDIDADKNTAYIEIKCLIRGKADVNNKRVNKPRQNFKWIPINKIKRLHNLEGHSETAENTAEPEALVPTF